MGDSLVIRLCHQQFQDHIWRGLEGGLSFSEARERAIATVGLPPIYPTSDIQKDHDEYEEEMSLGGRPYRVRR